MRAVLTTAFVLVSSAAWAQCANVNGQICGGAPTGNLSANATLFSGANSVSVQGSSGVVSGQRAVLGNEPGSVNLGGQCVVTLPASSSVSFVSVGNNLCIDGLRQAVAPPPNNNGLLIGGLVVSTGIAGTLVLVNDGEKRVSP